MRRRVQKLERLKFREFDLRAREALRSMLLRLPMSQAPWSAGRTGGDEGWLLGEVEAMITGMEPLDSPLAFYVAQLDPDELVLLRADVAEREDPEALPRWNERVLGRVRRVGRSAYLISRLPLRA